MKFKPALILQSHRPDLNRRPAVYETAALPLSYDGNYRHSLCFCLDAVNRSALIPELIPELRGPNELQHAHGCCMLFIRADVAVMLCHGRRHVPRDGSDDLA